MPGCVHACRRKSSERNGGESSHRDAAQTEPQLKRRGKGPHQAEEQHVDADGEADGRPVPSELIAKWVDENARRATKSGRADQGDEGSYENDPRVMESAGFHLDSLGTQQTKVPCE